MASQVFPDHVPVAVPQHYHSRALFRDTVPHGNSREVLIAATLSTEPRMHRWQSG